MDNLNLNQLLHLFLVLYKLFRFYPYVGMYVVEMIYYNYDKYQYLFPNHKKHTLLFCVRLFYQLSIKDKCLDFYFLQAYMRFSHRYNTHRLYVYTLYYFDVIEILTIKTNLIHMYNEYFL